MLMSLGTDGGGGNPAVEAATSDAWILCYTDESQNTTAIQSYEAPARLHIKY